MNNPSTKKKPTYESKTNLKPREKMMAFGAGKLTDGELLAIILGAGVQGHSVYSIANKLSLLLDEKWKSVEHTDIMQIKGVGEVKALGIVAALEFVRRRVRPTGYKIGRPSDVVPLIQHYASKKQEQFICITLNGAQEVMDIDVVTTGLLNKTQVHPREVFADAIAKRACSIIIAHNHPSGDLEPSTDDIRVTQRIKEASVILGIELLDHIIFSLTDHYSMSEHRQL